MSQGNRRPEDFISIEHGDLEDEPGSTAKPPPAPQPPGQQWVGQPRRWFVARTSIGDRTVRGPYEEQAIKQMLQWGQLSWEDHVSRGGNDPWRPIVHVPEFAQAPDVQAPAPQLPGYPGGPPYYTPGYAGYQRNHVAAGLLALFLGGIGIHKFYNGSWGWGILYILFCWTFVPCLVALIEGIMYLVDPQRYDLIYNRTPPYPWKW
jgi:TM2 domain-containing membrane protein YozV